MLSDAATNRTSAPAYSWRALIALLLFATLVRGGVFLAWQDRLAADPDGYRQLAENLAGLGDLQLQWRVAYRPPLYPALLFLTGSYESQDVFVIARLHAILGVLTVWITARLGAKLQLGQWSLLAGALVAIDPILVNQSALVMTETLATLLTVLALDSLCGAAAVQSLRSGLWCGATLGSCCLCRPTYLPFALLCPIALFALCKASQEAKPRQSWFAPIGCLILLTAILGAWTVRNYLQLGKLVVGTTHGGYTLYLGNNAKFYALLKGTTDDSVGQFDAEMIEEVVSAARRDAYDETKKAILLGHEPDIRDEVYVDAQLYDEALRSIQSDPTGFLRACLYRVRRFWGLVPYEPADQPALRYAIGVWYAALFTLALLGLWQLGRTRRLWQTPWLFGLLLVGTFMAIHTVYWTDMRMRAPVTPVVCLAAAVGVEWLAGRRRSAASLEKATT